MVFFVFLIFVSLVSLNSPSSVLDSFYFRFSLGVNLLSLKRQAFVQSVSRFPLATAYIINQALLCKHGERCWFIHEQGMKLAVPSDKLWNWRICIAKFDSHYCIVARVHAVTHSLYKRICVNVVFTSCKTLCFVKHMDMYDLRIYTNMSFHINVQTIAHMAFNWVLNATKYK